MQVKAKINIILQNIAESIDFYSDLPPSWSTFNNFIPFSKTKNLYDYQEEAIKNAIKILYLYYQSTEELQRKRITGKKRKKKGEAFRRIQKKRLPIRTFRY